MADPNLYRLTYESGTVKYGTRHIAGPAIANSKSYGNFSYRLGRVVKVEAVNLSDVPFADVTSEFLGEED